MRELALRQGFDHIVQGLALGLTMRSLRTILLVNLGLLTAASLLLVSVSAVVLAGGESRAGLVVAISYGSAALLVFLVFGAWLVRKMILTPLDDLARTAD